MLAVVGLVIVAPAAGLRPGPRAAHAVPGWRRQSRRGSGAVPHLRRQRPKRRPVRDVSAVSAPPPSEAPEGLRRNLGRDAGRAGWTPGLDRPTAVRLGLVTARGPRGLRGPLAARRVRLNTPLPVSTSGVSAGTFPWHTCLC